MHNDKPMYCVLWCYMIYDEGLGNFVSEPHQTYGPYDADEAVRMRTILREKHDSIVPDVKAEFTIVPLSTWSVA